MITKETVRQIFIDILRKKGDTAQISDLDQLKEIGRFDSLDIVEIISSLENHGAKFPAEEFNPDLIDSVQGICQMYGIIS